MSRRLRLAVIGLGAISESVHLPLIERQRELFDLTALGDLSPHRTSIMGARYGVPLERQFRTVDELISNTDLRQQIDAVLLATGGSHGGDLLALSRADFPVLCEKPVAFTTAEIDAIEDEVRRQNRALNTAVLVGYMKEHDPAVERAREELTNKKLRSVAVEVLHPADEAQRAFAKLLPAPKDVNRQIIENLDAQSQRLIDNAVGSCAAADIRDLYSNVILGSIIHDIALLRRLAGGIKAVDFANHTGGAPGSFQLLGRLEHNVPVQLGWHYISDYPDYRERVTLHHDQGSVEIVFSIPYILNIPTELRVTARRGRGGVIDSVSQWPQQEAFENELIAFHAMVTKGTPSLSGLEQGRADLRVGQLMIASLARNYGMQMGGEAAIES